MPNSRSRVPWQLAEIKASLRPGEALLALYVGIENAFVWSMTGAHPPAFARLPLSAADIEKKVQAVRQNLEPRGPQVSDLPRFDIGAAQQLYRALLEPVQAVWKDARNLIVVPHGPLGHLPFGLLVTPKKIHKATSTLPLDRYRKVPWLIREHTITVLPSSGSLLTLRLNADWVVLSACNTAAGEGAGREAVSGLGRAFFYAGTRALLVSNWPVESASARMLTTDLFKQQEADPNLSRAVALQKSMLKLLDEGVYKDPATGKPQFAYAHPVFWAPFSLVGDGRR